MTRIGSLGGARGATLLGIVAACAVAWTDPAHAEDPPLAIPADTPAPRAPPSGTTPVPTPDAGSPGSDIEVRPSVNAPKPGRTSDRQTSFVHVDAGYRLQMAPNGLMPIRQGTGWGPRPHLLHGSVSGLLQGDIYVGAAFEYTLNRAQGTLPFVAEARVGWWDNLVDEPERRGGFGTLPGLALTYVGARVVHDYYRGIGREWAGVGASGGLVLGYLRAAPFGKATVVSDSQFSLYLLGWKERTDFPLGLLNQRISVGFDPVFLDARFRFDPALGQEWSIGLSMQSIF